MSTAASVVTSTGAQTAASTALVPATAGTAQTNEKVRAAFEQFLEFPEVIQALIGEYFLNPWVATAISLNPKSEQYLRQVYLTFASAVFNQMYEMGQKMKTDKSQLDNLRSGLSEFTNLQTNEVENQIKVWMKSTSSFSEMLIDIQNDPFATTTAFCLEGESFAIARCFNQRFNLLWDNPLGNTLGWDKSHPDFDPVAHHIPPLRNRVKLTMQRPASYTPEWNGGFPTAFMNEPITALPICIANLSQLAHLTIKLPDLLEFRPSLNRLDKLETLLIPVAINENAIPSLLALLPQLKSLRRVLITTASGNQTVPAELQQLKNSKPDMLISWNGQVVNANTTATTAPMIATTVLTSAANATASTTVKEK